MRSKVVCVLLAAAVQAADAPGPVVAHWALDAADGGVLTDSGPNHLDAKLEGKAAPRFVAGQVGQAWDLTLADQAAGVVPAQAVLDLQPPFTIAAWIRPTELSRAMEIVCRKGDGDNLGYRFRYGWGALYFLLGDGQESVTVSTKTRTIDTNHWVHVAATHDGRTVRLFLNCEESVATDTKAVPAPSKRALLLGNYVGRRDAYPFIGQMDDIWILGAAMDGEALHTLAERRGG